MAGALTIDTLNQSSGVYAANNAFSGIAKAWVNFDGASPYTINRSFNISSVSFIATGKYQINMATPMPNANYTITGMAQSVSSGNFSFVAIGASFTPTNTSFQIWMGNSAGALGNPQIATAAVFA